jgi:hypothetical protein
MTSDNAKASSVVTNNKKPSVLRREMVNEIAIFCDRHNEIEFSDAACSLPCNDEDAHFDSEGDSFDATTFTFQPPEECAVLTSSGFLRAFFPSFRDTKGRTIYQGPRDRAVDF